jgi:hypothetical protein
VHRASDGERERIGGLIVAMIRGEENERRGVPNITMPQSVPGTVAPLSVARQNDLDLFFAG